MFASGGTVGQNCNVWEVYWASDSYLSVLKALLHASVACRKKLFIDWVPACDLENSTAEQNLEAHATAWTLSKGADGVLVPGGFGDRGIAVIEFARFVLGLKDANSTEFDPSTKNPV
ncbi:hypothetical protein MLD38_009920 [Melastoma candidum]|uniref:Uncharacterized protein n=1 Tax=Melastoma candidum TaxID=119954 RepID=A0ACB9R012_9MYRT|nr:hypothetical protein MLD38_009920 [Melastoma candidum]